MSMTFTDENIHDIIATGQPVVVDFWATWCGPCKKLAPIVEELAEEYGEDRVIIGKYNIDEEGDLAQEFRVMSIPTVIFFKNGKAVSDLRMVGFQSKDALKANIEALLSL